MKRQYSSSSSLWNIEVNDEHEPIVKRPRYFVSSPSTSSFDESNEIDDDELNDSISTINNESQTEMSDDNEIIEIEHEDTDLSSEHGIIVVSDSESYENNDDQEIDVTDEISQSVSSVVSTSVFSSENDDQEIVIQEEQVIIDEDVLSTADDDESLEIIIDNINNEIIDLTDDEPNSNSLERKLSTDVQQCPICLETLSDLQRTGVYLIITRCRHVMCTLCCRQLLATSSRCPLCRENVSATSLIPYCILT